MMNPRKTAHVRSCNQLNRNSFTNKRSSNPSRFGITLPNQGNAQYIVPSTALTRAGFVNRSSIASANGIRSNFCKYVAKKRISQGTFGEIWTVIDGETQKSYALKKAKNNPLWNESQRTTQNLNILREAEILMNLSKIRGPDRGNRMIAKFHDILDGNVTANGIGPCIVMELCGYSLLDYINYFRASKKNIMFTTIRCIAVQLFSAMRFIHNVGNLVHADLKLENIVIALDDCRGTQPHPMPRIKVIDFGNAMKSNDFGKAAASNFEIQTLPYRAPEVLFGNHNDISSVIDMWSIGCILCELYAINLGPSHTFKRMFRCMHNNKLEVVYKIYDELSSFPSYVYNELNSLHHQNILYGLKANSNSFCHGETSYAKLKTFRMHKLIKKFTIGSKVSTPNACDESNQYQSELISFIDLIACLLDLDPYTRYNANNAPMHKFMLFGSNSYKINPLPSNEDNNERQMKINQRIVRYQQIVRGF